MTPYLIFLLTFYLFTEPPYYLSTYPMLVYLPTHYLATSLSHSFPLYRHPIPSLPIFLPDRKPLNLSTKYHLPQSTYLSTSIKWLPYIVTKYHPCPSPLPVTSPIHLPIKSHLLRTIYLSICFHGHRFSTSFIYIPPPST